MECGEGMIAIVRGLKDASLAVTVLDGDKKYTLQPDQHKLGQQTVPRVQSSTAQCDNITSRSDNAVQATDGRYASTYKIMHCHMLPTSPLHQVTEFPPQRAELSRGHGNFEIGGRGSGETYHATRATNYRGGLCWSDRGSVFTSRPSVQPDAFASSLRKYPSLSPERSSEIVERLINFTQSRNYSINKNRSNSSPERVDSNSSHRTFLLDSTRNCKSPQRNYEPRVVIKSKRSDESPTRERWEKRSPGESELESWRRGTYSRNNDVRYFRDVSRIVREGIRNMTHTNNQPDKLTPRDGDSPERRAKSQKSGYSVNMETQAAVEMVSREVVTMPKEATSQRSVAVPSAEVSSEVLREPDQQKPEISLNRLPQVTKQDITIDKQNQETKENDSHELNGSRISKSFEEIRFRRQRLKKHTFDQRDDLKRLDNSYQRRKGKYNIKYCNSCKTGNDNLSKPSCSGFRNCDNTNRSSNQMPKVCYTRVIPYYKCDGDHLSDIIHNWLSVIPMKPIDYFSRPIEKEYLFYDLFNRLKHNARLLLDRNDIDMIKGDVIELLNEFPVDFSGNRDIFLDGLANILVEELKKSEHSLEKRTAHRINVLNGFYNSNRYIPPTEEELRYFLTDEIKSFFKKAYLKIDRYQRLDLTEDILDVATLFMERVHSVDESMIKDDIVNILSDYGVSIEISICFSNTLIKHLKRYFIGQLTTSKLKPEAYIVLPNISSSQTPFDSRNNNNADFSILSVNDSDIQQLKRNYTQQLSTQINEWLVSVQEHIPRIREPGVRQAIIQDLVTDIMDRQRYLQLNPASTNSTESELDHLKFQIFKWMDENNFQPLEHASDLMTRIRNVPVPLFSLPSKTPSSNVTNHNNSVGQSVAQYSRDFNKSNESKNVSRINPNLSSVQTYVQNQDTGINNSNINTINATSAQQINDEYEKFLLSWVQRLPIITSSQEEEALAAKARIGIVNGILQANMKVKYLEHRDRYLLEDMLDNEIEELLNCLPQTPELKSKKHAMKIELIEKTVNNINQLLAASYKEQLAKNLDTSLLRQGLINERERSILKPDEEIQVKRLIDNYILYRNYKDDKLKGEVYKKRLFNVLKDLIGDIKSCHGDNSVIDYGIYIGDIMNALQEVPLPNDETFRDEADFIILEMEIEKWFMELPILNRENISNQLDWKKKVTKFAKKIHEIEKKIDSEDYRELLIKSELVTFLGEDIVNNKILNLKFVCQTLLDRIKNKDQSSQASRRVSFHEPESYDQFSSDVPFSSSHVENRSSPRNTSSNDRQRRNEENYRQFAQERPFSSTFADERNTNIMPFSSSLGNNRAPLSDTNRNEENYRQFSQETPLSSTVIGKENVNVPNTEPYSIHQQSQRHYNDHSQGRQENSHRSVTEQRPIQTTNNQSGSPDYYDPFHVSKFPEVSDRSGNEESYKISSEERPRSSSFKEVSNQEWHTLPESYESIQQTSRAPTAPKYNQAVQNKSSPNTSQVDGQSGYKPQMATTPEPSRRQGVVFNGGKLHLGVPNFIKKQDEPPIRSEIKPSIVSEIDSENISKKYSIECQTPMGQAMNGFNDSSAAQGGNIRTIATNTPIETNVASRPITATGQMYPPATGPGKKRLKVQDDARRHVDFDESDDEDDGNGNGIEQCRCIERFWKYGRRARYHCDDMKLPPCFPFMYNIPRYFY